MLNGNIFPNPNRVWKWKNRKKCGAIPALVDSLCQRFSPPFPYPPLFPYFLDLKNILGLSFMGFRNGWTFRSS